VVALSDLEHFVTYQLVSSSPAVTYSSALFKIEVKEITVSDAGPKVFIEWTTDFSNDASAAVVEDSRFKKRDGFKALAAYVAKASS